MSLIRCLPIIPIQSLITDESDHITFGAIPAEESLSRLVMRMLFDSAVENELLAKNPVTKSVKCKSGKESKAMRALTISEQKLFLKTIKGTSNYNQYALLLQTGLRTGEMIGLRWADVDFEKRLLHIRRTMEYRHSIGDWRGWRTQNKKQCQRYPINTGGYKHSEESKRKAVIYEHRIDSFPGQRFSLQRWYSNEKQRLRLKAFLLLRQGRNRTIFYACSETYVCNTMYRKWYASQNPADDSWALEHRRNYESLCSRDGRRKNKGNSKH